MKDKQKEHAEAKKKKRKEHKDAKLARIAALKKPPEKPTLLKKITDFIKK